MLGVAASILQGSGPAGLLIALPHGFNVSGVTLWAVRLVNALAARRRAVGLIVHPEPAGQRPIDVSLHPAVCVIRVAGECSADGHAAAYVAAVDELAAAGARRVVFSPNILGECYGVAAAATRRRPGVVRVVGWQHSDNTYDARVLAHYEPMISRFVGVSGTIAAGLRRAMPGRVGEVVHLPYGVEVVAAGREREETGEESPPPGPLPRGGGAVPIRLLYLGRLEHRQKRVMALPMLSTFLEQRGIAHTLTIAGDGPAADELARAVARLNEAKARAGDGSGASGVVASVRLVGAVPPARVPALLAQHDFFVLPSRYEGLSVALLEAMAAGCVPIVTRTNSGAAEAVESGVSGMIADVPPDADEPAAAAGLAAAIEAATGRGREAMSQEARRRARDRFSIERHVAAVETLLDEIAADAPRPWPEDRPCSFAAFGPSGSGSVPADGPARLAAALEALAGRGVIIHGAGEHTRQLAAVLARSPARIVAFADDDRARHRDRLLGLPVIDPAAAGGVGATDVLISSWMHQDAIWDRREVYMRQGLHVHRLYE